MQRLRRLLLGFGPARRAASWLLARLPSRPSYGRRVLEEVLLPSLRDRPDMHRLLFVGCSRRTRTYPELFRDREFWTLDIEPSKARFGSDLHIVDSLTKIADHFERERLDAVICVGVFGWGLDDREGIAEALRGCARCLRPGGLLIIGWNDVDEYRPPLAGIEALECFEPAILPPLPSPSYPTYDGLRLRFDIYTRPAS